MKHAIAIIIISIALQGCAGAILTGVGLVVNEVRRSNQDERIIILEQAYADQMEYGPDYIEGIDPFKIN